MVSPDESSVRAVLAERLPVRTSWATLELASAASFTAERPLVPLRWSRVARDGAALSSLEGAMNLGPARRGGEPVSPERLRALLQGFADFVASATGSLADSLTELSPAALFDARIVHKKGARTREDFYRLFLSRFGSDHAEPASAEGGEGLSLEAFAELAKKHFPVTSERCELVLSDGYAGSGPASSSSAGFRLCIQLLVYELVDGERRIRDIKEQEVYMLDHRHRADPARVDAYLGGLCDGLKQLFEERTDDEFIDCAMPHQLLDTGIVSLARPKTRDDFYQAYCRRKKLGAFAKPA
jgi:hypothetical protein